MSFTNIKNFRSRPSESAWLTVHAEWLLPVLLACITALAFLPAFKCGFVNWDDNTNFLGNLAYRGLGLTQLRWMFTTYHGGPYQPLSWATLGLDYVLWGMNPVGYHLTNIFLHALNAALFFALSLRLLRLGFGGTAKEVDLRWGAAFAALFFAVHPLRVESVAWITERRDVLSGVFYLASAIWYLRFAGAGTAVRIRPYLLALFYFAAALFSKATGIGMVFALLALDIYPLKRLPSSPRRWFSKELRPVLIEKLPFLTLGLAAGVVGFFGQQQSHGLLSIEAFGMTQRIVQALYSLAFYLWKTLLPVDLLPYYKSPAVFTPFALPFLLGGITVIGFGGLLFVFRKRQPGLVSAAISYLVFLGPVIGILKMGTQIAADRYTYLACGSWAIIAGALLVRLQNAPGRYKIPARAAALAIVAALAVLTWRQTYHWRDSETLWRYTLAVDPDIEIAHNSLGNILREAGHYDEAIVEYQAAIRLKPNYWDAVYNMTTALYLKGRGDLARPYLEAILQIKPDFSDAHINLGNILQNEGRFNEAVVHYQDALKTQPDSFIALFNLGNALYRRGQATEAMRAYKESLRLNPAQADVHIALGNTLQDVGRFSEAVGCYRKALNIQPDSISALNNLANTLYRLGQVTEAERAYKDVLRLNPSQAEAYNNLGSVFLRQGKIAEAVSHFQRALQLQPDMSLARQNLMYAEKLRDRR